MLPDKPVILFDGVCNLCNRAVQFIIKRDKKKQFLFASLQGKTGTELLRRFDLPADQFNSFVLIEKGKAYTRSTATLRVAKKLSGGWSFLYGLIIVPPFLRDPVYNLIAKRRYQWFGKRDECMIPTPELKERFLD
ncbi:MAG TPA: thiol-disulfide oxidoreductase DCC family protein [Chitinophagaceae bacterium]|nr:thiol-disulfide oxidoreductase DCC family protein [Chitinophagaceae bacterium]